MKGIKVLVIVLFVTYAGASIWIYSAQIAKGDTFNADKVPVVQGAKELYNDAKTEVQGFVKSLQGSTSDEPENK